MQDLLLTFKLIYFFPRILQDFLTMASYVVKLYFHAVHCWQYVFNILGKQSQRSVLLSKNIAGFILFLSKNIAGFVVNI